MTGNGSAIEKRDASDETLAAVLAEQVRSRGSSELWMSAVGGSVNAILVATQFPSLRWLAGAFTAAAAYGTWGLIDRWISRRELLRRNHTTIARAAMVAVGAAGWMAALYAAAGLFTAAVGTLGFPGS